MKFCCALAGVLALAVSCGSVDEPAEIGLDVTTMADAPIADRLGAASVWTGTEAIFWGGSEGDKDGSEHFGDGAAYDPAADSWRVIASAPLEARTNHAAVWTGDEMVVSGGMADDSSVGSTYFRDAAAYDPATDSWRSLPAVPDDVLRPDFPILAGQPGLLGEGRLFFLGANALVTFDLATETWEAFEGRFIESDGETFEASRLFRHEDALILEGTGYSEGQDGTTSLQKALVEVDPSSGALMRTETLPVEGDALVSLGDELAMIDEDNRTIELVALDGSDEVLATVDRKFFSYEGLPFGGLVSAGDWIVSVEGGVLGLLNREEARFYTGALDSDAVCALGPTPLWTGDALVGWNGIGCEFQDDESDEFTVISGGAVVKIQDPA